MRAARVLPQPYEGVALPAPVCGSLLRLKCRHPVHAMRCTCARLPFVTHAGARGRRSGWVLFIHMSCTFLHLPPHEGAVAGSTLHVLLCHPPASSIIAAALDHGSMHPPLFLALCAAEPALFMGASISTVCVCMWRLARHSGFCGVESSHCDEPGLCTCLARPARVGIQNLAEVRGIR